MRGEMFFVNQMLVKCFAVESGWAWLRYIDPDGVVRVTSAPASALMPLREFLAPRTAWPKSGDLDLIEAEKEERAAAAERKTARRASRKSRRSQKIKRAAA